MNETIDTPAPDHTVAEDLAPRCAVLLVLDTSHSMWGTGLAEMMTALRSFHETLFRNEFHGSALEIGAIEMGDDLRVLQDFTPLAQSSIAERAIRPKGDTPIGGAPVDSPFGRPIERRFRLRSPGNPRTGRRRTSGLPGGSPRRDPGHGAACSRSKALPENPNRSILLFV